ncbi:MAG: adenylate/guanylate cyclase domain-containing protein [Actinomycetota bacterium]
MTSIKFAQLGGGGEIAYRELSAVDGPSIVHFYTATAAMELLDEERMYALMLQTLAQAGHLVVFDKPGIGASDPIDGDADYLDQLLEAHLAVLDAVDVEAAWLFGGGGLPTACLTALLAERHPERLLGAVLVDPVGRGPMEIKPKDAVDRDRPDVERTLLPSRDGDQVYRAWSDRAGRLGASAAAAQTYWEALRASASTFLRQAEPITNAPPILLLHRRDGLPVEHHEWWAGVFPSAEKTTIEGADRLLQGLDAGLIADEAAAFITGQAPAGSLQRELAAVLFTDLVDSTRQAAAAGDANWRSTLDRYELLVRRSVERHAGSVIKHTGDGALATFDSATAGLRCASDLRGITRELGLLGRTGLHVGEVELRGTDIGGIAVHLASRVMDQAADDSIAVSSTVVAASMGNGFGFDPLGSRTLKGIDGEWDLFVLRSAR